MILMMNAKGIDIRSTAVRRDNRAVISIHFPEIQLKIRLRLPKQPDSVSVEE